MNSPASIPSPADPSVEIIEANEFIVVYRALEPPQCSAIIELFNRDPNKWRGKVEQAGEGLAYQDDIKRSWDLEILNEGPWQPIFQSIHPRIVACFADYLSRSPILKSFDLQATGYKIQMYPKQQGYFRWHADSVSHQTRSRVAAMVLYLNDVAQGGETEFFHQGAKITPKAGHLLMFPVGWNYMHCGHVPVSDDKYIIQTFIKIKD
jgi:hypothetical protein